MSPVAVGVEKVTVTRRKWEKGVCKGMDDGERRGDGKGRGGTGSEAGKGRKGLLRRR